MMPRKKRPADQHLGIQVLIRARDAAQRARWQKAADRDRRTLSDWIRCTLDDAAAAMRKK